MALQKDFFRMPGIHRIWSQLLQQWSAPFSHGYSQPIKPANEMAQDPSRDCVAVEMVSAQIFNDERLDIGVRKVNPVFQKIVNSIRGIR